MTKTCYLRSLKIGTMIFTFLHGGQGLQFDTDAPLDISLPLLQGAETVNCFYAPLADFSPVVMGDFVGSTAQGGVVNFMNVRFNPHGNGTHTECVGHIAREPYTIRECLQTHHFVAKLVSIYPTRMEDGDRVILPHQLAEAIEAGEADALIVRTLPNDDGKKTRHYSNSNPPYIHHGGLQYLADCGIKHLLIDLPSVDREQDGGKLSGHHAFWQYPAATRADATITELIFVNNLVADGVYMLNLQIASFDLDASPSKPVLYRLLSV